MNGIFQINYRSSIRLTVSEKERVSCRELVKKFNTLSLASECTFLLLSFVVKKKEKLHQFRNTESRQGN
jgi:hypothetical protein